MSEQQPERGFCQCGCGQRTKVARYSRADRGHVKGEPLRFVVGHYANRRFESDRPCSVDDCERPAGPSGLCLKHQRREWERARFADPEARARRNAYAREWRQRKRKTDPAWRAHQVEWHRDRHRERLQTDPEYREAVRSWANESQRRRLADSEYRAKRNGRNSARDRERYASDPKYRDRVLAKSRRRYATDPEFRANVIANSALYRGFQRAMGF